MDNWIQGRHSGKVMDIDIAYPSGPLGAPLQQWDLIREQANQRFTLDRLDDGYRRIRVAHTNMVLDVWQGSADNGSPVVQWDWHGGDNQRFAVERVGNGLFRIRAKHSGRVLDVTGASNAVGARIIQWDWHGSDNQIWSFPQIIDDPDE
jgi:hypothetical protein